MLILMKEGSKRMQWKQIKTIFIVCFLILDIYLLVQFLDKRGQADIGIIERQESSIEEQLEAEDITYGKLPEEESEESFISVKQKKFPDDEFKEISDLKNQKTIVIDKKMIVSQFEKPISISPNQSRDKIESIAKDTFIYPDEYTLWNWNEDMNVLIFFQEKKDRPVYYNHNGLVLIFLNDDHEMEFYVQTMLEDADDRHEPQSLIEPLKAIETLYEHQELEQGDDITTVDIGLHTRVPLEDGVPVFVPTWKVTVYDDQNYFVNAMEVFIFSSNEVSFLEDTIEMITEQIQSLEDEDLLEDILSFLNQRIDG